jgi:hypothetical protein
MSEYAFRQDAATNSFVELTTVNTRKSVIRLVRHVYCPVFFGATDRQAFDYT